MSESAADLADKSATEYSIAGLFFRVFDTSEAGFWGIFGGFEQAAESVF